MVHPHNPKTILTMSTPNSKALEDAIVNGQQREPKATPNALVPVKIPPKEQQLYGALQLLFDRAGLVEGNMQFHTETRKAYKTLYEGMACLIAVAKGQADENLLD